MTGKERRPDAGEGHRGDADHSEVVSNDGIPSQLRRRRGASYRCPPLADGRRDPLDRCAEPLTDAEMVSWRVAWRHLRALGLPAVVPQRVLTAGVVSGAPCQRDAA